MTIITTKQADTLTTIATLKGQARALKGRTLDYAEQRKAYRNEANALAKTLPANVRAEFLAATADGPAALAGVLAEYAEVLPE